jgi:hypothetical protein
MRLLLTMLLVVCLCGTFGYGDRSDAAESKEGARNKKTSALPNFKTPKDLVNFVFKTLKDMNLKKIGFGLVFVINQIYRLSIL